MKQFEIPKQTTDPMNRLFPVQYEFTPNEAASIRIGSDVHAATIVKVGKTIVAAFTDSDLGAPLKFYEKWTVKSPHGGELQFWVAKSVYFLERPQGTLLDPNF